MEMLSKRIRTIIRSVVVGLAITTLLQIAAPVKTLATSYAHIEQPRILMDRSHLDSPLDDGATYQQYKEREIANRISDKVANILVNRGYSVTFTREYDKPISINDRVQLAQRTDYDLYLSVHLNSCEIDGKGTGSEAFYNGSFARMIGDAILKEVTSKYDLQYRRNEETPYYTRRIPNSLLLEVGFINNSKDMSIILENEDALAEIVANNIIASFEVR